MSTKQRSTVRASGACRPDQGIGKIPQIWRLALLPDAIERAGRADLVWLAQAGLAALTGTDTARVGLAGIVERLQVWPTRVDRAGQRARILSALLLQWRSLEPEARASVRGLRPEILRVGVEAVGKADPSLAADWLEKQGGPALVGCVRGLLAHPDRDIGRSAARSLLRMMLESFGIGAAREFGDAVPQVEPGSPQDESVQSLVLRELRHAVASFDQHRQRDVAVAALILAEGPVSAGAAAMGLGQILASEDHAAVAGLRTVMRRVTAAFMRERAWRFLSVPSLASAAADRLGRTYSGGEHEAVLGAGHLVLHPARRRALRGLKVATRAAGNGMVLAEGGVLPDAESAGMLSEAARRWLPEIVDAVQADETVGAKLRAVGLVDPSAFVRHAHARRADPVEQADYAFDGDARVARSAALSRSLAGTGRWTRWPMKPGDEQRLRTVTKLMRSPHARVREVARQDAARMDPWLVDLPESRLAAREWMDDDRAGFLRELRERIGGEDARLSMDAIRLARALRVIGSVEPDLVEIIEKARGEVRVIATAAAALGDAGGVLAGVGIERALASGDDRVRANAVESAARLGVRGAEGCGDRDVTEVLIERKSDVHHRVRANALRGLMAQVGAGTEASCESLEGLRDMLTDERDMHRLAGLWLAERTIMGLGHRIGQWNGGAGHLEWMRRRIAGLAVRDQDESVRQRAASCARKMLRVAPSSASEMRAAA